TETCIRWPTRCVDHPALRVGRAVGAFSGRRAELQAHQRPGVTLTALRVTRPVGRTVLSCPPTGAPGTPGGQERRCPPYEGPQPGRGTETGSPASAGLPVFNGSGLLAVHREPGADGLDLLAHGVDHRFVVQVGEDVADPAGQFAALGFLEAAGGDSRGADAQAGGDERGT